MVIYNLDWIEKSFHLFDVEISEFCAVFQKVTLTSANRDEILT